MWSFKGTKETIIIGSFMSYSKGRLVRIVHPYSYIPIGHSEPILSKEFSSLFFRFCFFSFTHFPFKAGVRFTSGALPAANLPPPSKLRTGMDLCCCACIPCGATFVCKELPPQRTVGTIGSAWQESTPSKETLGPAQTNTQSEFMKTNSEKWRTTHPRPLLEPAGFSQLVLVLDL